MMNHTLPASTALLVPSCDRYSDVWHPFFALFKRHWRDCPFPVYLGTNHVTYPEPGVTTITVGDDLDWSLGFRTMLAALNETYVVVLLEDFLLLSQVDTGEIVSRLADLVRLDGAYLRLRPFPPPDVPLARFSAVGEIVPGAPYRASMQAAIWHRESLMELLKDGENPWQMELYGARRSDTMARGFYSTWEPALDYYAGVTMGKWIPYAVSLCREQGADVDLTARPLMTPRQNFDRALGRLVNIGAEQIPWRIREKLIRWVRATGLRRPPTRSVP